jgi:hypothetical protein
MIFFSNCNLLAVPEMGFIKNKIFRLISLKMLIRSFYNCHSRKYHFLI